MYNVLWRNGGCSSLNENEPWRLIYFNACPTVGRTVWEWTRSLPLWVGGEILGPGPSQVASSLLPLPCGFCLNISALSTAPELGLLACHYVPCHDRNGIYYFLEPWAPNQMFSSTTWLAHAVYSQQYKIFHQIQECGDMFLTNETKIILQQYWSL